jgi:hypothetical protein
LVRSFDPNLTQDPTVSFRRRFDVSAAAGQLDNDDRSTTCGVVTGSGGWGCGDVGQQFFWLSFGGARASCFDLTLYVSGFDYGRYGGSWGGQRGRGAASVVGRSVGRSIGPSAVCFVGPIVRSFVRSAVYYIAVLLKLLSINWSV